MHICYWNPSPLDVYFECKEDVCRERLVFVIATESVCV